MHYIQLTNDSYILNTSVGVHTLTIKSFNFSKIKKLINEGAKEEEILPLLLPPKINDGVYEAYLVEELNVMIYKHYKDPESKWLGDDLEKYIGVLGKTAVADTYIDNAKFMGIYTSLDELEADWPEYAL